METVIIFILLYVFAGIVIFYSALETDKVTAALNELTIRDIAYRHLTPVETPIIEHGFIAAIVVVVLWPIIFIVQVFKLR